MQNVDRDYLEHYQVEDYERPSVTVDTLIFTASPERGLELLLIRRDEPPFFGHWALPGGFIRMDESLEDAAARKLQEEAGLSGIPLEQLYTFGSVGRDPRTRVISVAYFALVPSSRRTELHLQAGSGAKEVRWVPLSMDEQGPRVGEGLPMAFDHLEIIQTALERLRGKLSYTDLAFGLLADPGRFAIYELQKIYEAILGQKQDTANFRRMFLTTYVSKGLAEATGEECYEYSRRASQYYRYLGIRSGSSYDRIRLL